MQSERPVSLENLRLQIGLVTAEYTRFGTITFHPLLDRGVDILEASVDVAEMHAAMHEERVIDDDDCVVLTED